LKDEPRSKLLIGLEIFFAGLFAVLGAIFEWIADLIQKPIPHVPIPEPPEIELANTQKLFDETELLTRAAEFPEPDDFFAAYMKRTSQAVGTRIESNAVLEGLFLPLIDLYLDESLFAPPSRHIALIEGSLEAARFNDKLIARRKKLANPERTLEAITTAFDKVLFPIARCIPREALKKEEAKQTVPLFNFVTDLPGRTAAIVEAFDSPDVKDLDLFSDLRKKMADNTLAKKPPLRDTAFEKLFNLQVPFDIPTSRMLEHAVIVAGSGHGKTQTLGAIISQFLESENTPALVVLDSTGALVRKVQNLALFNDRLRERIVIIDPEHESSPSLNMFDISNPRLEGYSQAVRESVETEIVALFNYVFTSAQNDLTSRQGTVFSYVVRLVLSMPNATIHTLRQVLEDDPKGGYQNSRYRSHIDRLDPTAQDFFKNQYFELKGFREQIAQRVYGLVQIPAFERMFANKNKVDFYDELQNRGSIILVNTSERLLKENGSPLFGRYIIARTLGAAFERASIPEQTRRPTFLIVDEAAPYFDDTFEKILTRVRQFKLGVCLAFQHMEQASEKLRSAIASNTSVKMAGGLGYTDSRWLSRDMETTPEFLKAQHRDSADPPQWTELACYVRNFTPQAVSLTVPFYLLEKMPQMAPAEHRALLERNRARVSSTSLDIDPAPLPQPPRGATHSPQSPPLAAANAPPPPRPQEDTQEAASEWQ